MGTKASRSPGAEAAQSAAGALRLRAEAALRETALRLPQQEGMRLPGDMQALLHDLRVHQIELEMQNEELRRAQEALEVSHARYFDLYDLAPVGYCSVSASGLVVESNLTAAAMLGITRGGLVRQPFSRFILGEDQDGYYRHRKRVLESSGWSRSCELRLVRGGGHFWAKLVTLAAKDDQGAPLLRIALVDISERKSKDAMLAQMLHEQAAVLDSEVVGIVKTRARRIVWCNALSERMLGHAKGGLLDKPASVLFASAEAYRRFGEAAYTVIEAGGVFRGETQYRRGDGGSIWLDVSGTKLYPGGEDVVWSLVDTTERRAAEEAERVGAQRLSALSRRLIEVQEEERAQLARELHDEIGQVLTAVRLNLKVIERQDKPGAHRDSLARSLAVVERAIEQVRAMSLSLRPPVLDELGLVAALHWLVQQQGPLPEPRVSVEAAPEDLSVPAEVAQACYRVAQEALTNAIRHACAATVRIRVERDGSRMAISVRDDGRGFEPDGARARAGFGLLGMRERVKLADGTLQVDSAPGKGTEVRAQFGLAQ